MTLDELTERTSATVIDDDYIEAMLIRFEEFNKAHRIEPLTNEYYNREYVI